MRHFVILERLHKKSKESEIEAVKEGFSFQFLFFNFFWLIYKRMFSAAILFISFFALLNHILNGMNEIQQVAINVFLYVLIALKVNDARVFSFEQLGFQKKNVVLAYDSDDAKLRYLSHG
jgi:hypothetical protein